MTAKEIREFFLGVEEHAGPLQERYNQYLEYKRNLEERAKSQRSSHEFGILEEYPKPVITVRDLKSNLSVILCTTGISGRGQHFVLPRSTEGDHYRQKHRGKGELLLHAHLV